MRGPERDRYVDIHCHCLPAMDDGPATLEASLSLCGALYKDGVRDVIATPHQLGRYGDDNEAAQIRERVAALNERLQDEGTDLRVWPGGDVRVDERLCRLIETDKVLTLADRRKHVLLELPHEIFIDIEPLLVDLSAMGIQVVISHPERHPIMARQPELLAKWLERSALLQVTCASLLGDFGPAPQAAGWNFLGLGWTSLVATDSHDVSGRRPRMSAAFEQIGARLGPAMAWLLCVENPSRVLDGNDVVSTRALARTFRTPNRRRRNVIF